MKRKQVAIFGGSFNPPTVAHGAILKAVADMATFDEVWVMPSKSRSDKHITQSPQHRSEMVRRMLASEFAIYDHIRYSDFELRLPGRTQTAKTLRALARRFPEYSFTIVIGEDSLATMPDWEEGEWLLENGKWLVVPRVEKEPVRQLPRNISYVPIATEGVSSTRVRGAVSSGQSIRTLVHASTEDFITKKGLYHART